MGPLLKTIASTLFSNIPQLPGIFQSITGTTIGYILLLISPGNKSDNMTPSQDIQAMIMPRKYANCLLTPTKGSGQVSK